MVCIFWRSVMDLHLKLSTAMNPIRIEHSAGKYFTPLMKISGGDLKK